MRYEGGTLTAPTTVGGVVSPAPRADWAEVLATDPTATAEQTPQYFEAVLAATGGADASRLYRLADGRRLVVPLVRERAVPGLRLESGYPVGFGHGGILASGGTTGDDVRTVLDDLVSVPAASIRLDGGHHTADQFSVDRPAGVQSLTRRVDVIDLSGGWEQVFGAGFRRTARQSVRKAERCGLRLELDTTGRLLPAFYDVYLAWTDRRAEASGLPRRLARRLAERREPWAKFEAVATRLGDRCRTWVAWHGDRPVASSIALVHGQHAIGWRSYSIRDRSVKASVNTYVQSRAIEDACASGCAYFDLGQSGGLVELERFKESLGGRPRRVVDLRVEQPALSRLREARDRSTSALADLASRGLARRTSATPTPTTGHGDE